MNLQSKNISKRWATIVVLICGIFLVSFAAFQLGLSRFHQLKARSRPQEFSGDWAATGIQGDLRGTVTFLSNGRIDSHDDYAGRWWFESGAIHTQMWEENPSSLVECLFPKRMEYVFAITRNEKNRPSVMQNTNLVLTHSSSWNQQRTSPNKAVNPSGGWYKFLIPSGRI